MWSLALGGVGITGLYLARDRPRAGWAVALAAQALWVAYAVTTRQWGFLPMSGAYAVTYWRLLRAAAPAPAAELVDELHDDEAGEDVGGRPL